MDTATITIFSSKMLGEDSDGRLCGWPPMKEMKDFSRKNGGGDLTLIG